MRYKFYSVAVIIFAFAAVIAIYLIFGRAVLPTQQKIEIKEHMEDIYEMDEEILSLEHGDPT